MSCKESSKAAAAAAAAAAAMDNGKYVRYTPEQVEALERLYHDCPKPSSIRRQQLIRECPILSHIEPKQIKVWFQNRRYICRLVLIVFSTIVDWLCMFSEFDATKSVSYISYDSCVRKLKS